MCSWAFEILKENEVKDEDLQVEPPEGVIPWFDQKSKKFEDLTAKIRTEYASISESLSIILESYGDTKATVENLKATSNILGDAPRILQVVSRRIGAVMVPRLKQVDESAKRNKETKSKPDMTLSDVRAWYRSEHGQTIYKFTVGLRKATRFHNFV